MSEFQCFVFHLIDLFFHLIRSAIEPLYVFFNSIIILFWTCLCFYFFVEILTVFIHSSPEFSEHFYDHYFELFISEFQFSHSVVSNCLRPHGLQHARLPWPSPTPRACSKSCPWSQWCHPTISSSVVPGHGHSKKNQFVYPCFIEFFFLSFCLVRLVGIYCLLILPNFLHLFFYIKQISSPDLEGDVLWGSESKSCLATREGAQGVSWRWATYTFLLCQGCDYCCGMLVGWTGPGLAAGPGHGHSKF